MNIEKHHLNIKQSPIILTSVVKINSFKCQPHKMVKHSQTIRCNLRKCYRIGFDELEFRDVARK